MEMIPAVDASQASLQDSNARLVVEEMNAFRKEMREVFERDHELKKFWLRKTNKPVLAVLLVQSAEQTEPVLFRGTNMEVSMPTGSLCAERNVIGSALARFPALKREDLKLIAVLSIPLVDGRTNQQFLHSASSGSLHTSTNSLHARTTMTSDNDDTLLAGANSCKGSMGSDADEWVQQPPSLSVSSYPPISTIEKSVTESSQQQLQDVQLATPRRRITLFNHATRKTTERTVDTSFKDLNPLPPCGACHEWLKKIAESNPYFYILTFTDAECHGVYITPCQDK
jgi:cytidine deaminase